jgi:epoxyqueuosine reductase
MNDFSSQIQDEANKLGADFYGVANLTRARDFIVAQGGDLVAPYTRGISIGIALLHPIVDQLPRRNEHAVAVNYRHHAYDVVNERLDQIASRLASILQREGFKVLPIPASKRVDSERISALFSHKLAAHLAGLGWIGKSCLLITPQAGPRVRWATVLTNAPLPSTGEATAPGCGNCRECVDICPVKAFSGRLFRTDEPREMRYTASKCDQYLKALRENEPDGGVCGMCLYICPYGRRNT